MTDKTRPVDTVYATLPSATDEPISPRAIMDLTGMGYSTVTRHLRALKTAGRADQVDPIDKGPVLWFATRAANTPTPAAPAETPSVEPIRESIECWDGDAAWRPARPGDTPGALVPGEGDAPQPVDLAADDVDPRCPESDCGEPLALIKSGSVGHCGVRCAPADVDAEAAPNAGAELHDRIDDQYADVLADGDPSPVSPAPAGGDVAAIAEWMADARRASTVETVAPVSPPPAADPLTAEDARALTDDIRGRVTDLLPLIKEAFTRRADLALGYASWAAYCDAELAGLRMPLQERQAAAVALRREAMSTRAIAGALGTSDGTVRRDLRKAGATDDAPVRVVGLDNKQYASHRTAAGADTPPADASGEGPDSSGPDRAAAAPVASDQEAGATGVTPSETAAEGLYPSADGADASTGVSPPALPVLPVSDGHATPAPAAPVGAGAAGVTPTETAAGEGGTPNAFDRLMCEMGDRLDAAVGVRVIDGDAFETPDDPGPMPEPPLPDHLRKGIDDNLGRLALAVGNLAVLLRDAGPHGGVALHSLRHWRHEMDLMIRRVEAASDDLSDAE